jgi:hypothetical protein
MMYAVIRVIGDIVFIVNSIEEGGAATLSADALFKKCEPWVLKLADVLDTIDPQIATEIKGFRGAAAKSKSRIKLQLAFHEKYPEFTNDVLEAYIKENDPSNTDNASRELKLLSECLIAKIKETKGTDDAWLYKFAPEKTINSIRQRTTSEETKRKINGDSTPVDFWSFISYDEIAQIVGYASNWTDWLQVILTANGQLKKTKVQTINWLKALDVYEKRITDSKAVLGSQYTEIHELFLAFGLE